MNLINVYQFRRNIVIKCLMSNIYILLSKVK